MQKMAVYSHQIEASLREPILVVYISKSLRKNQRYFMVNLQCEVQLLIVRMSEIDFLLLILLRNLGKSSS